MFKNKKTEFCLQIGRQDFVKKPEGMSFFINRKTCQRALRSRMTASWVVEEEQRKGLELSYLEVMMLQMVRGGEY